MANRASEQARETGTITPGAFRNEYNEADHNVIPGRQIPLFPNVDETQAALVEEYRLHVAQYDDAVAHQKELALRIDTIVSSANSPELREARKTVRDNFAAIGDIQNELRDDYAALYRKHGAKFPNLIADDAFALATSGHYSQIGIMQVKVKSRGIDSEATKAAAIEAAADPEIIARQTRQAQLHAEMSAAAETTFSLARELAEGDEVRDSWTREARALQIATDRLGPQVESEKHAAQIFTALTNDQHHFGFKNAAFIDPADIGDYPVTADADGALNILAWYPPDSLWCRAVSFTSGHGNVDVGATLTLDNGIEISWSRNLRDPSKATPVDRRIAVIKPVRGARELGPADGWLHLISTVDSSG